MPEIKGPKNYGEALDRLAKDRAKAARLQKPFEDIKSDPSRIGDAAILGKAGERESLLKGGGGSPGATAKEMDKQSAVLGGDEIREARYAGKRSKPVAKGEKPVMREMIRQPRGRGDYTR